MEPTILGINKEENTRMHQFNRSHNSNVVAVSVDIDIQANWLVGLTALSMQAWSYYSIKD